MILHYTRISKHYLLKLKFNHTDKHLFLGNMTIKKKKNSSAENKNYNIVNRAVQTDTGANLKTFILKKKKKRLSGF